MAELKPCPFCGSSDVRVSFRDLTTIPDDWKMLIFVKCNVCLAQSRAESLTVCRKEIECYMNSEELCPSMKNALANVSDAWNRRATDGKT